jgi:uncharacterized protein
MTDPQTKSESPSTQSAPASPQFAAAAQPSYVSTVFLGPDGLRPGWGFAFFVAIFLILQQITVNVASSFDLGPSDLWSNMLEELGLFIAAAIPSLVLAKIERRPWKAYGLPAGQAFGKLFWQGALWGFAAITLLILALSGSHTFSFGHIVLHGVRIAKFAAFWAAMFLLVGFAEEFLFRGYAQFTLARGIQFWPAAIVLSSTFGLVHLRNGGEAFSGALAAACIGLFFCLTLRRTGNLWFAVGFHAAWDWGETFFYSVPDSGMVSPGHLLSSSLHGPAWLSGGSVGPEGSVFCFLTIAAVWIAFARVYANFNLKPIHY